MPRYAEISEGSDTYVAAGAIWVVERRPLRSESTESLGVYASRDGVSFERIAELDKRALTWIDGSDLVVAGTRFSPDGDERATDAKPPKSEPSDEVLAKLGVRSSFDRDKVAGGPGGHWFIDRNEVRVLSRDEVSTAKLGKPLDDIEDTVLCSDRIVVLGSDADWGIFAIDRDGVVRRLAAFDKPAIALRKVWAVGDVVLWSVEHGLMAVHATGGAPLCARDAGPGGGFEILGVDGDRVVVGEFEWQPKEGVRATRPRPAHALHYVDVPQLSPTDLIDPGESLHDSIKTLAMSDELRSLLASLGIERIADVELHAISAPLNEANFAHGTELRYALAAGRGAPPIRPEFLARLSQLGLPPGLAESLGGIFATVGSLLVCTQAELLKTKGIGRESLAKIVAATEAAGYELGMRWSDMGS